MFNAEDAAGGELQYLSSMTPTMLNSRLEKDKGNKHNDRRRQQGLKDRAISMNRSNYPSHRDEQQETPTTIYNHPIAHPVHQ